MPLKPHPTDPDKMVYVKREYNLPREWVGLTDEEKVEIQMLKWWDFEDTFDLDGYTRAVETKLKEKNI